MIRTASRNPAAPALGAALVVLGGIVAAVAVSFLAGTKTGFVLALLAIGGPVVAYLAIVAPLVVPFGVYVAIIPFDNLLSISGFGTLTKILGILSGLALIFYLVRTRKAVLPSKSLLLWVALYIWAATTAFWAVEPDPLFTELGTSAGLILLYAAISVFPADRNVVRWTSFVAVAGGVCAAIYGAYLFHNGTDIYYGGRLRITNETGSIDPNHFAAALLLPIALCLTTLLHTRKLGVVVASFGALVLLFVGIALSASRGGALAIAAMIVYFLIRSRARIRLFCIIGASLIAAIPLSSQSDLVSRLGEAFDSGGSGRTAIWKVGLEAIKSHWLFGIGYGNFTVAYDKALLQTPHLMWADARWHSASHNLLVGTWVELGIIGLALLLAAWLSQFFMLRDIAPSEPEYPLRIAAEASVLGIFIAALFLDVMTYKYVWLAFMFLALLRNAHIRRRRGLANA